MSVSIRTGHFQLETFLKLCESREDALRKEQLIEVSTDASHV